jgi:hypothetical protein
VNTKQAIMDKSNKNFWHSKKILLTLIFVISALLVFGAGLFSIILQPVAANSIVNLANVVVSLLAGTMSATILHVSILDYKSVISLENVAKSETVHNITENITETITKTLRPKNVDDYTIN